MGHCLKTVEELHSTHTCMERQKNPLALVCIHKTESVFFFLFLPQQSPVRLQCVRALQGLYQEREFIGRLELFTNRFKVRHPPGLASFSSSFFLPLSVCLSVSAFVLNVLFQLFILFPFCCLSCFSAQCFVPLSSISLPLFFTHSLLLLYSLPLSGRVSGGINCCQLLMVNKLFSNT